MITYWLRFELESDTTFGRGDGVPGLVDQEIATDEYGCPYLHGRTLKGLLNESCADILFALDQGEPWKTVADNLFGRPGSDHSVQGIMQVGHARLPQALRTAVRNAITRDQWNRNDVLHALTAVRRQTAVGANGVPDPHTLRAVRVILPKTPFEARLGFSRALNKHEQALLAACVKGLRRAGTARNRGRGRLSAWIEDEAGEQLTEQWFDRFRQEVCP